MDHPNISLVLHYSLPYDLIGWMQQAGRGVCDGSPAHTVIVYTGNPKPADQGLRGFLAVTCFRQFVAEYF